MFFINVVNIKKKENHNPNNQPTAIPQEKHTGGGVLGCLSTHASPWDPRLGSLQPGAGPAQGEVLAGLAAPADPFCLPGTQAGAAP